MVLDPTYQPKTHRRQGGDIFVVANGGRIEVEEGGTIQSRQPLEHHTADDTLLASESGSTHTNLGEDGAMTLSLPPATVGLHFYFSVMVAQALQIDPDGTETIALPSTAAQGAAGKYLTADVIGEFVHLVCETAGTWVVPEWSGDWEAEG